MIDFKTFKSLSRQGNLIALSESFPADLETPVSAFLKIARKEPNAFLLESAEQEEKIGRYSIMGISPEKIFVGKALETEIYTGLKKERVDQSILEVIKRHLAQVRLANPEDLPGFGGGFVGYLSYENVCQFENIKLSSKKDSANLPGSVFFLSKEYVIFDHFRKKLTVALILETNRQTLSRVYKNALGRIQFYKNKLQEPLAAPLKREKTSQVELKPHLSKKDFINKVRKIKSYIRAGDCIQVVLSQKFSLPALKEPFSVYRALRSINPSPYMFYFKSNAICLVGSSPEMLVRKSGWNAEVRPIAGTRPRGKTYEEDLRQEQNLRKSKKEIAEHLMLVDLGRNDLGRVCEFHSVKVKNFARVDRYSHVMHLVSEVAGTLKKGKTAFDLLAAAFPAGTVSGAPKVRAMQIIDELEPEPRGPYAGSLGYFSFKHDMDMCIVIRTLFSNSKQTFLQAGAGIVKDSNPEHEYQETVNKARALVKALQDRHLFPCSL